MRGSVVWVTAPITEHEIIEGRCEMSVVRLVRHTRNDRCRDKVMKRGS